MSVIGFVAASGGSIGVLLGGILTDILDWHWIFLVNPPVGVIVFALCVDLLPSSRAPATAARLDVAGVVTVTPSLMLAVYAVVNGNEVGWTSARTIGLLAAAVALLATFLVIEAGSRSPLMPLELFRLRNVATANVVGVLWAAPMFAWFFLSALYVQLVLGYGPLDVGLSFLPANPAAGRTNDLATPGVDPLLALDSGYHLAFVVGAVFAAAASVLSAAFLRLRRPSFNEEEEQIPVGAH